MHDCPLKRPAGPTRRRRGRLSSGLLPVQQLVVAGDHIGIWRQRRAQFVPRFGEQPSRAIAVEPVELALLAEEHPAQHQSGHPLRMGLRERQRGALRAAEKQPSVDAQVLADPLDVRDEMLGGVVP